MVFIYVESLERTFFDENIFPGLTDNLREIKSQSISFTNIIEDDLEGVLRYTMGGVVASQCGFPPLTPSYGNSMSGLDTYLEGATCLGDLLNKEKYYLAFYGGADLNFAGKGNFFQTHGFHEIMGKNELMPKVEDGSHINSWGIDDDFLLEVAYERFLELSKDEDKFALFLLTLDTHHPTGLPSHICKDIKYQDGKNEFLDSIACADFLVPKFIEKVRDSEYSNDTVIVVVSDHLAIRNTATDLLNQGKRTNLLFVNEPNSNYEDKKIDSLGSMLDITPTILPFIGYEGKIGFGRDLSKRNESTEEILELQKSFGRFRHYLLEFWSFPKIEHSLGIDIQEKKVYLDNRKFDYPILIELNENLETKLKFGFDTPEEFGLISHINSKNEEYFILIDSCEEISTITSEKVGRRLCLFAGTLENNQIKEINSNLIIEREQILKIIGIE